MTMEHITRSFAVSLHVLHPSIDPNAVTRTLQLAPWRTKQAGPPRKPPYDQAWWSHLFERSDAPDLVPFLEQIVVSLQGHRDFLRTIVDTGGSIELFCGIEMSSNWDEVFPHTLSAGLAELGVDLRLDAYAESHKQA
jgi:hypothetical protein